MCVSLMATNLVKWWKTKFLNGYKQFTVLPSSSAGVDSLDGRPSDTEELLGPARRRRRRRHRSTAAYSEEEEDEDDGGESLEGGRPATPPPTAGLQFEGIECDVSVDERPASSGAAERKGRQAPRRRRQEFSFTLYDFDGHGKITKDDITGLVTTIYETIGSTVRVPHYGSKTIKVKLTVSPGERGLGAEEGGAEEGTEEAVEPTMTTTRHRVRFHRDVNVTIRERRRRVVEASSGAGGVGAGGEVVIVEAEVEGEEEVGGSGERGAEEDCCLRGAVGAAWGAGPRSPVASEAAALPRRSGRRRRRQAERRSGSLQRQELLRIIQANMEKNNLGFQTSSRKHCGQDGHHHHQHHHVPPAKHVHSSPKAKHQQSPVVQRTPADCRAPILDCGGHAHYLDSEGCDPCRGECEAAPLCTTRGQHQQRGHRQHQQTTPSPTCVACAKSPGASAGRGAGGGRRERGGGSGRGRSCPAPCGATQRPHLRSRSHDLSFPYHFLVGEGGAGGPAPRRGAQPESGEPECGGLAAPTTPPPPPPPPPPSPPPPPPHAASCSPPSAAPPQPKHRNNRREEEQARAMAQVVRWLERGHFLPPPPPSGSKGEPPLPGSPNPGDRRPNHRQCGGKRVQQQQHGRREYRHVHEHIHHHYHHYQETAIIV